MGRVLVQYYEEFGNMGSLHDTFVASEKEYEEIQNISDIYAGELLGKHSEVILHPSGNTTYSLTEENLGENGKLVFDILEKHVGGHIADLILGEIVEEENGSTDS